MKEYTSTDTELPNSRAAKNEPSLDKIQNLCFENNDCAKILEDCIYTLDQCFSTCVPPEIFRCAAKFMRILQFARDFKKLGENFKNFPYKVSREKIFYFLVCREPKKVEKQCA
jgi:hypothetical protein